MSQQMNQHSNQDRFELRINGYQNAINAAMHDPDPMTRETAAEWLRSVQGQVAAKITRKKLH